MVLARNPILSLIDVSYVRLVLIHLIMDYVLPVLLVLLPPPQEPRLVNPVDVDEKPQPMELSV